MQSKVRGVFLAIVAGLFLINCQKEDLSVTQSDSDAVQIDEDTFPKLCTELYEKSRARAFGQTGNFWTKNVLRVRFLGGSAYVRSKVRQYAQEWSRYANIQFQFVDQEPSDIRISFDSRSGSWSYVGRSNQYVSANRATMNFGWFNSRTSDTEFRRTTLHEFGHALGLSHEHQHPLVDINWNKPAVYNYYGRTQDWSRSDVDQNIFSKYNTSFTNYTDYDPQSIMHYYIPRSLVFGSWQSRWNTQLSPMDKSFIGAMYPGTTDEEVPQGCSCPEELRIVACEDFENHTQGTFADAEDWQLWSPDAGHAELQTYSWGRVIKMQYAADRNPDILYSPTTLDEGQYNLSWSMYVGPDNSAYFNIQKGEEIGSEFGGQMYFDTEETGRLEINNQQIDFNYNQGTWFTVSLLFDFDHDEMIFLLDNEMIYQWPISWRARSQFGANRFTAINFYAVNAQSRFWLDDFCLSEGLPAAANARRQLDDEVVVQAVPIMIRGK